MRTLAVAIFAALGVFACNSAPSDDHPAPSAKEQPAVRPSAAPPSGSGPSVAGMPADCVANALKIDLVAPPSVPVSAVQAVARTDPLGQRPTPLAAILARVTASFSDGTGQLMSARPVWLVYRVGEMAKPPSGGPFLPGAPPRTTATMFTASIAMVDALTGEPLWGTSCGAIQVPITGGAVSAPPQTQDRQEERREDRLDP